MKKSNFKINVSDLLLSAGKTDEISFENKDISNIKNLGADKISGTILLQSFDQTSLLATLKDVQCLLTEDCDRCLSQYNREVHIPAYQARFQTTIDTNDENDDEIYLIDEDGNVDLEEMISNAIKLQEPFVKKCDNCQTTDDDDDEEDFDEFSGGTVAFR